jgi:hypothetical protein
MDIRTPNQDEKGRAGELSPVRNGLPGNVFLVDCRPGSTAVYQCSCMIQTFSLYRLTLDYGSSGKS